MSTDPHTHTGPAEPLDDGDLDAIERRADVALHTRSEWADERGVDDPAGVRCAKEVLQDDVPALLADVRRQRGELDAAERRYARRASVAGRCPACGWESLALADGGHVTCRRLECTAPEAADGMLHGGREQPVEVLEDGLCRRVWAAAVRDVAGAVALHAHHHGVASPGELATLMRQRADRIASGDLTPWADQPESSSAAFRFSPPSLNAGEPAQPEPDLCGTEVELGWCAEYRPCPEHDQPATAPVEQSGDATAAAGPHPDTPAPSPAAPSRVYVAGPITGVADYRERFAAAAEQVRAAGYEPVVPVHDHDDRPWEWYMRVALLLMLDCDRVLLLPGWEASRGAQLERQVATACGMPVAESMGQLPASEPLPEWERELLESGDCGYGQPPCNRTPGHPGPHYRLPRELAEPTGMAGLYQRLREPKSCPTCSGLRRETVGMVCQTCSTDYGPPPESAPDDDAEMEADITDFAALPDCGECGGTGKQVPPGWYERRRETERWAARLLAPAVDAWHRNQALRDALQEDAEMDARQRAEDDSEPGSEPDSGPGWERYLIDDAIRELPGPLRLQVESLLADRDRLATGQAPGAVVAAWSAELAEVTADRDRLAGELDQVDAVLSRHGIEHPRGAQGVLDLAGMAADAVADAVAAALERAAAEMPDAPDSARQWLLSCAEAARTAWGTRPVPGSPQPADRGGDDAHQP